jgi:erythromycin esterase-like protein
MFKFAITIFLIFIGKLCFSQKDIKSFVMANVNQIATIDPAIQDYSDLQVIGDAIGDAKIVMLGEQDHGDAPTFLAKTRLIKYLHEKKGFNVLAFESDFFGINYNWQLIKDGKLSFGKLISQNITALWSQCTACDPLFKNYLPTCLKSNNPLQLAGFDSQMGTTYLLPIFDSLLTALKLPITKIPEYRSEIFPLLNVWYNYTKDNITCDRIISTYEEIKKQMLTKLSADDFWVQTVKNLIQQNTEFRNWKQDYWKDMNTRDRQMADNLKWLAETKYPGEKIIVWAHNYHVSKYAGHYPENFLNKAASMGSVFAQDTTLANRTYIIGFTSYEGTAGRLFSKTYKIEKPKPNSFENWINPKYSYAFVDFKAFNRKYPLDGEPFYMSGAIKGNRYHSSQEGAWNRIFDGVFYIRDMYPCDR